MEERIIHLDTAICPHCSETIETVTAEYSATAYDEQRLSASIRNTSYGNRVSLVGDVLQSTTDTLEFYRFICPACGEELDDSDIRTLFGLEERHQNTTPTGSVDQPVLQSTSSLVCGDSQGHDSIELCKKCNIPVYREDEFICTECMNHS